MNDATTQSTMTKSYECRLCGWIYGLHDHLTVARQRFGKAQSEGGGTLRGVQAMTYLVAKGHYETLQERFREARAKACGTGEVGRCDADHKADVDSPAPPPPLGPARMTTQFE